MGWGGVGWTLLRIQSMWFVRMRKRQAACRASARQPNCHVSPIHHPTPPVEDSALGGDEVLDGEAVGDACPGWVEVGAARQVGVNAGEAAGVAEQAGPGDPSGMRESRPLRTHKQCAAEQDTCTWHGAEWTETQQ